MAEQPRMPSAADELPLAVLEDDENVPPRPEEDAADVGRSTPDPHVNHPADG